MANARGKSIDNTHLSIDQAERRGFIHRDYIAHCLRWSHVIKRMTQGGFYKEARILDIGCGVDVPLAKTLYSSRLIVKQYIGIDYNPLHKFNLTAFHSGKFPCAAYGGMDFATDQLKVGPYNGKDAIFVDAGEDYDVYAMPNIFICFEMLEHIEPEHVVRVLEKLRRLMLISDLQGNTSRAFISTPNYAHFTGAAANHVNEMRADLLGYVFEELGFSIDGYFGTFASQKDYKDMFLLQYGEVGASLWENLSAYYDSNYLATVFAPLYPLQSRNVLWELGIPKKDGPRMFPNLPECPTPLTSSENWEYFKEMFAAPVPA